jgi:subfamily B ATP-binding cassette protein MsbA
MCCRPSVNAYFMDTKTSTNGHARPPLKHRLKQRVKQWATPKDRGRRLIARNLWQHRGLFTLTMFFTFAGAAFEGVGLGLLIPFIESLTQPDAEPFRTGIAFVDTHILAVDADIGTRLFWVSGLILSSIFIRGLLGYAGALANVRLKENIVAKLRREVIDQIQAVSLRFFSKTRAGDILNTLTSEVGRVNNLFGVSHQILVTGSMALIYASALLLLSWQLALIGLALSAALFLVMNAFIGYLRDFGRKIPKANAEVTSIATELIRGIRTVIISGTQKHEAQRFKEATDHVRDLSINLNVKTQMIGPVSQAIASTALIAIIVIAVQFFILPGLMSAAMLLAFLFAIFRLLPMIQQINGLRGQWAQKRGSLDNLSDFLSREDKHYLPDGPTPFTGLSDSIKVQNVSFAYQPDEMVLEDISLSVSKGETVAFVGASGAGKSTLADVMARLYDPTQGRVLLDGIDMREYKIQTLREHIAVVSQDTFLFNDTVYNNLTYGLDEDVPMERVRWAAEKSNAQEFIENLEDGFDTLLGDRGTRLSGGQRQRVAIARALLRDPDILILDEATSALDSVTENIVQEAMERLMEDRTVIVIAHRLSTIEHADKVVVLEEGEVVEQGPYGELIAERGQLWEYHRTQYQVEAV